MTDADALEQLQTWLVSGGDSPAPTDAVARAVALATAHTAVQQTYMQAMTAAADVQTALAVFGISQDGSEWRCIGLEGLDPVAYASAVEAAQAQWNAFLNRGLA